MPNNTQSIKMDLFDVVMEETGFQLNDYIVGQVFSDEWRKTVDVIGALNQYKDPFHAVPARDYTSSSRHFAIRVKTQGVYRLVWRDFAIDWSFDPKQTCFVSRLMSIREQDQLFNELRLEFFPSIS